MVYLCSQPGDQSTGSAALRRNRFPIVFSLMPYSDTHPGFLGDTVAVSKGLTPSLPSRHPRFRLQGSALSTVGRIDRRNVGLNLEVGCPRCDRAALEHEIHRPQQIDLRFQAQVADFFDEHGLAFGGAQQTQIFRILSVEAGRVWPNSSLSIKSAGKAALVRAANGTLAFRQFMDDAGHLLSTGSGLADD